MNILVLTLIFYSLTGIHQIQAQTYGPPLFTEDFGTVPAGQDVNQYRGEIGGRGTIGNIFWFWPRTCSGSGWITSVPTLEVSHALTLPASEQGVTEWVFFPVSVLTGTPYTGTYLNNPAYLWCLTGTTWTGPNPGSCSGTLVRWYNVCGTWKIGNWERYRLRTSVPCTSWSSQMDDGGYALSTNPRYVHSPNGGDGSDVSWHDGPDHTAGDVNGMMLVVNATLRKGLFYKRTITGLCYGSQFEYKSYYANVLKPTACGGNGLPINIRYEIWDKNPGDDEANSLLPVGGTACNGAKLLAQTNTGVVNATTTLTWYSTSIIFIVPQNQDSIFIVLRNNGDGGCGNDLAIDDITFRPFIPFTIGYERIPTDYCATGLIRLKGTITSGSIPPDIPYVFQWQEADINTSNWVNIGSPIPDFANAYIDLEIGSIGNKIFRLVSAASEENLNNTNCYVASVSFNGNSIVLPTGSLTVTPDICGTPDHAPVNVTFTVNYLGNIFPWTYYYRINGGTEQSQIVNSPNISDTKTIPITDSTTVTLVKISTVDCDVIINSDKFIQYSIGPPGPPIEITGPNPACIGSIADFSVNDVQGAISYNWVVSDGWQIISGQGTRFVRLFIGSTPITVSITTVNACGTNIWTSPLFTTTTLPPDPPADITMPNGICFPDSSIPGNTDVLIEASVVLGAQNYFWEWDSPVVLGTQQSGTGQFLRKIILSVPNNVDSFNVRVRTQNECGYSSVKGETFYPDNTPPVMNCPGPLTAQCTVPDVYPDYAAFVAAGGSASDDLSGILISSFAWISDDSDGNTCPEVITRTYGIKDTCLHQQTCTQTITIMHTTAPTQFGGPVSTNGGTVQCLANATAPITLPVVKDICGNILSVPTPTHGGSYAGCNGTYTWIYTYKDCANLEYVWTYTYTITYSGGLTPPVNTTATVSCPSNATDPGAPANITDACGRTVSATLVGKEQTPNPVTCNGSIVWRYRYTACDGTTSAEWT
jgi:hypothetical protein